MKKHNQMIKKRRLSQSRDPNFEYPDETYEYHIFPVTEEEEEAWKELEKTSALIQKSDDS